MSATQSSDWSFEPKVWADHVAAYFDRKLVYGASAFRDNTLESAPGTTVNFPYFKKIGDAEEPAEDESLLVDNLSDDSFNATVKEVGKAVGIKKKAFKKSAASRERIIAEAQAQIGRVHAEKVDKDLLAEFSGVGNFRNGFTATAAAHVMNVSNLLTAKIVGLGDRADEAVVCQMHSLQYLDLLTDTTAGFLKADANDPMAMVKGFMGYLLGMAIIVVDTIPKNADIDSKDAYRAFIHTAEPYGIMQKQMMEMEDDYDILAREWVVTGNEWYAVKSFHSKIDAANYRTIEVLTTVSRADGV
jgi:N4-gp56 family major capsid protein